MDPLAFFGKPERRQKKNIVVTGGNIMTMKEFNEMLMGQPLDGHAPDFRVFASVEEAEEYLNK